MVMQVCDGLGWDGDVGLPVLWFSFCKTNASFCA